MVLPPERVGERASVNPIYKMEGRGLPTLQRKTGFLIENQVRAPPPTSHRLPEAPVRSLDAGPGPSPEALVNVRQPCVVGAGVSHPEMGETEGCSGSAAHPGSAASS